MILFNLLIILFTTFQPGEEVWIVKRESMFTIRGSSNIGRYSCNVASIPAPFQINCIYTKNTLQFEPHKIYLPVKDFSCGNPIMTKDFNELLKADKHPFIFIEFIEMSHQKLSGNYVGKVRIKLLDIEKTYTLELERSMINKNSFFLSGQANLLFNDFNLKPPSRLGGLLRIDEKISVNFQLEISTLSAEYKKVQ
jgi:hypothetical protein